MSSLQKMTYMDSLPLVNALYWFIENVSEDDPERSELFFYIRRRYRIGK